MTAENFHALQVASVRRISGGAVDIWLDVPLGLVPTFAHKPGQHVAVRATIGSIEHERTYTICNRQQSALRLAIRHVAGGTFSTWANTALRAGDMLAVARPTGRFILPPASGVPRHLLMLAAGIGITPIMGMTLQALETEPDSRVTLVYGSRTLDDAVFLPELEDLKDLYPARLDLIHVLSRVGEADNELLAGRIDGLKIKALAASLIDFNTVAQAFLCGPGSFIKETRNALFELGLARETVQHEFFIGRNSNVQASSTSTQPPLVGAPVAAFDGITAKIIIDGKMHEVPLAQGQNVLAASLAVGLKPPYACTAGMCSTCRARVVEGSVTMAANFSLEEWEIKRGFVLTCQAVATSARLVVDYDAM